MRLIDTRIGLVVGGPPASVVAPGQAVCAKAVGEPGDVAVVNGTPVGAGGAGYMAVRSSDDPSNNTPGQQPVSNWNFAAGSVDPNVAFARIGSDGRICVDNSLHTTVHMVLDQAGYLSGAQYEPASESGATRLVDTRIGLLAEPPATTPPTTSTTLPGQAAEPPGPPRQIGVQAGPGRLTLTWLAPSDDGGAPVDEYRIERAPAGNDAFAEVAEVASTTYVDTHLATGEYVYRIAAHNEAGWGPASTGVVGRPDAAVPPDPVQNLRARTTPTTATLAWDPPADDGGAAASYLVVRFDCTFLDVLAQFLIAETVAEFTGLRERDEVCFRVTAVNSAGSATQMYIYFDLGVPTEPPCSLQAVAYPAQDGTTGWEAVVQWETPYDDGGSPIIEYRVYLGRIGGGGESYTTSSAAERAASFQVLAGEQYYASVYTVNSAVGGGDMCATAAVTVG